MESEIGSGGGGAVYKAWHKRMQKYVVVKEYKYGPKSGAGARRNELEALKNVKCEYLPQVFDYIAAGKRSYTVMEYIEGESFDKLLRRGKKATQSQVFKWYDQLASALKSLHRQDVCHRDIKPANIMLTPNGDVCLIDFNTALVGGENMFFTSRSLGYASPEQYELYERLKSAGSKTVGSKTVGSGRSCHGKYRCYGAETQILEGYSITDFVHSDTPPAYRTAEGAGVLTFLLGDAPAFYNIDWKLSDIYSLGATMYHLLTGRQPPKEPAEGVSISDHGSFDEGLTYIIEKSMQLRPSDRFASAAVLTDMIRQVEEHNALYSAVRAIITVGKECAPALQ